MNPLSGLSRYLSIALLGIALVGTKSFSQIKTKVLWLGGGSTSHNPLTFANMATPIFAKSNLVVDYRTNESILNADSLKRYDVLFIYNAKKGMASDGTPDLTTAQEDALYSWVRAGHVIVGVHSANSSYLANPKYQDLFGGPYTVHGDTGAYKHISIVNPTHPALKGVLAPPATGNADYWDEGREIKITKKDTVILARATTASGAQEPWTWVRPEGQGWVYYTSSGHDERSWSDANFQNQLIQALKWGASFQSVTLLNHESRFSSFRIRDGKVRLGVNSILVDITGSTWSRDSFDPRSILLQGYFSIKSKGGN
jgi:uncharacterized protein